MKKPLPALVKEIGGALDMADLKARLLPATTHLFDAKRAGLFLLADMPTAPGMDNNPVVEELLRRHAPLHEEQVVGPQEWSSFCSRADHGHVLVGPLVRNGELVGVLAFTRQLGETAFDERDVANLSALCLHASTRMAQWRTQTIETEEFALSPRERDIVLLVARGKTNAQIGSALFVSSETVKAALKAIFRKTGVSSRAQLVARLRLAEAPEPS